MKRVWQKESESCISREWDKSPGCRAATFPSKHKYDFSECCNNFKRGKSVCPNKQQVPLKINDPQNSTYYQASPLGDVPFQAPLLLVCMKNVPQKQPPSPTSHRETLRPWGTAWPRFQDNWTLLWTMLSHFFLGLWHLERWPRSGPWLARGEERGSWQHAAHQLGHSKCLHQTASGKMAGWVWVFALLLKSQLKPLLSFNLLTPLVFKITFTSFPSGAGLM